LLAHRRVEDQVDLAVLDAVDDVRAALVDLVDALDRDAAGLRLPKRGKVFISVKNADKRSILPEARELSRLGYELLATEGTWRVLKAGGIPVERVNKVHEGRPHIVDRIKNREIDLVLNTPMGKQQREDDDKIRSSAVQNGVACITTFAGISAVVQALAALHRGDYEVRKLQEHHAATLAANATKPAAAARS
jgi:carbamoyl-phosphate synthase large subunit